MGDEGHYEQVGDIQEWRWNKGHEPKSSVPVGEFDPRSAPAPKAELAAESAEKLKAEKPKAKRAPRKVAPKKVKAEAAPKKASKS